MHLCGPELTTTSYSKRKQKVTKAQQEELERGWRERNQRLKEIKLPKETFEQYLEWVYGKGKKEKGQKNPGKKITKAFTSKTPETKQPIRAVTSIAGEGPNNKSNEIQPVGKIAGATKDGLPGHGNIWTTGACKTKQTPTYTGTKIIGIAVLHKSCLQPIFSQEEAIEVAHMRR